MRLFTISVLILEAILFASALSIGYGKQRPLSGSSRLSPAASVNSFDSLSATSSSSSNTKSKLTSILRASTNALTPSSTSFRCHSKSTTNTLSELYAYIESVLKRYEDLLFKKKGNPDRITFETCLAGYTVDEVAPAIYFGPMTKEIMKKVEDLLRSQEVRRKFPGMGLVSHGGVLAVVMGEDVGGDDKRGLRRRNTL